MAKIASLQMNSCPTAVCWPVGFLTTGFLEPEGFAAVRQLGIVRFLP